MKDLYREIIKPGTIAGQIYFLTLGIPRTVSKISKYIYNGRVQLAHINRVIEKLESKGYIEQVTLTREERRNKNFDLRAKFWKAKSDLLVDYCAARINSRPRRKKISDKSKDITDKEKSALKLIFDSKWFSSFFKNEYLEHDIDIDNRNGDYLRPSNPFQFLGFTIEEIGAVSFFVNAKTELFINTDDLLKVNDFDKFVFENNHLITDSIKGGISKIIKNSKRYLGNYEDTNFQLDYMIKDYNIFFIPNDLASKLTRVGRIPLTLIYSLK